MIQCIKMTKVSKYWKFLQFFDEMIDGDMMSLNIIESNESSIVKTQLTFD